MTEEQAEWLGQSAQSVPRPYVLVVGDEDQRTSVSGVFPTERGVSDPNGLHLSDFDAVVSFEELNLRGLIILFGLGSFDVKVDTRVRWRGIRPHHRASGEWLEVESASSSSDNDRETADLVRRTIKPGAADALKRGALDGYASDFAFTQVLLRSSDGTVIAGRIHDTASGGARGTDAWILPAFTTSKREWVRHIWSIWHADRRLKVGPPTGFEDLAWMTHHEQLAQTELSKVRDERQQAIARFDQRDAEAHQQLEEAQQEASAGLRRLLTEQGEPLEEAARQALEQLGFAEVVSMDEQQTGMKREDLQIRHQDLATGEAWMCLVEVKGTAGGAQSGWLGQSNHQVEVYARRINEWPDARWVIANTERGKDPGARSDLFTNNNALDVETYGEAGGLVVPTRDLFRLVRDVQAGAVSPEEARRTLMSATGVWAYAGPEEAAEPPRATDGG